MTSQRLDGDFGSKLTILLTDLRPGGAERVCVNIANAMVERGYQVEFVLLQAKGDLLPDLNRVVKVIDIKQTRLRNSLIPLVRYLKENKPDAVLANIWPLTVISVVARFLSNTACRLVVAEHTTWSRSELLKPFGNSLIIKQSMKMFFPHADRVIAVSKGAADDLAEFASVKRELIDVIYNPISGNKPKSIAACDATLCGGWLSGHHKKIIAVGTLKEIKDYPTLLKAFSIVLKSVNARLLILGEGEMRESLQKLINDLGLLDFVIMPGFVKDPTPYFQQADLHVLSSTGEGFANVIVEALAVGTPVVSTDCPSGPREILEDGKYGRLVPVADSVALAHAMIEALSVVHDTDALKSRAMDFSIGKSVDRYEKILFH